MNKIYLFAVVISASLAGCSKAPSEVDIASAAIKKYELAGCTDIKLKAEKTNSIPGSDSNHLAIEATVTIEFPGKNDQAAQIKEDEKTSIEQITKKSQVDLDKELKTINSDPTGMILSLTANTFQIRLSSNIATAKSQASRKLVALYEQGCAKKPYKLIESAFAAADYKKPIILNEKMTLPMIKTENGWLLDL